MIKLENDVLIITIDPKGAELKTIYHKNTGLDYMWSGDPAYWAKTSPVLFPIVGSLKNDTCFVEDKPYIMGRHGFAREMEFKVVEQSSMVAVFRLESNDTTLAKFPFPFVFDMVYAITNDEVIVSYLVTNRGDKAMYFSVGGHPAFKVPLIAGHNYNDYYLEFNETETAKRWPISKEGLIETTPVPFLENTKRLQLSKELFYQDAIVFKDLRSWNVSLLSSRTEHGLHFFFEEFPFLGIWAFKNADFVCIEPWCGVADPVNSDQQLNHKEGIVELEPAAMFERRWKVKVF